MPLFAADDSDLPAWAGSGVDHAREAVGGWVDSTARSLDGFFGSPQSLTVDNNSFLRITQENLWEESEGFNTDLGLRFRLDLPTSKERLRLLIESDPEESLGSLAEQGSDSQLNERISGNNAIIGLDKLDPEDKRKHWSYRYGAGLKVRTPIDPYIRATGERLWSWDDSPWELNSYNRLSWFDSDGYSARTEWELSRPWQTSRLRSLTQLQWQETEDTLEFSQRFDISKTLDGRSRIRNGLIIVGESLSNSQVDDYYLQSWYRRDIHKGILFMDLIPELHFSRESDFDPRWAVTLRFELYLSKSLDF
jgi:hypothetical protein